eukprot:Awhi_evm1s14829
MNLLRFEFAKKLEKLDLSKQWILPEEEFNITKEVSKVLQNTHPDEIPSIRWYILEECKKSLSRISSHRGLVMLVSFLRVNRVIKKLILTDNNINAEGIGILFPALKDYNTLHELVLKGNRLGSNGAKKIAVMLRENQLSIAHLLLGSNNIGVEGALHIALALEKNKTLFRLSLTDNNILAE